VSAKPNECDNCYYGDKECAASGERCEFYDGLGAQNADVEFYENILRENAEEYACELRRCNVEGMQDSEH